MPAIYSTHSTPVQFNGTGNISVPTHTDGDALYLVVLGTYSNHTTVTPPSGWTLVGSYDPNNASESVLYIYERVASSEPSTYSWTFGGGTSNQGMGTIICVTGNDPTTPTEDVQTQLNSTLGTSHTLPSATSAGVDRLLLGIYFEYGNRATNTTYTAPSGMTERAEVSPTTGGSFSFSDVGVGSGATGAKTFTTSANRRTWAAAIIVAPENTITDPPAGTTTISNATGASSTTATITYSYSAGDATGYEYRIDGGSWASIGTSPATITGLSAATEYSIEVRAINGIGNGTASSPATFGTWNPFNGGTEIGNAGVASGGVAGKIGVAIGVGFG